MEHLRIYLVLALIFACGLVATAQDKQETKNKNKNNGNITKEYDKADDKTDLSLPVMPITCVKDGCIFFSLRASYKGTKLQVPVNRFIFGLYIFTKTLEPFADSTLLLRVDGKPIDVGAMTFAGKVSEDGLDGLAYGIPLYGEELKKIADAKKAEMSIGSLQFALGEREINAINDFYNYATTVK